jgi:PAS domain S-box-containing protein
VDTVPVDPAAGEVWLTLDTRGLITDASERLCQLTGLGRDALVGTALRDHFAHRRRAEEALRSSEARFRRLSDSNVIGIFMADTAGAITEANDVFLRMVGYSRDDLLAGRVRWDAMTPAEWRDQDQRALAEVRARGACGPLEKEYIRRDGSRVPILVGAAMLDEARGLCVCWVLDLTEQKRLQEQVRRQNQELTEVAALLDSILEGSTEYAIVATDLEGNILTWNEGARRINGYTAEEMVGRQNISALEIPVGGEAAQKVALLETALQVGKAEGLFERIHKDGHRFKSSTVITVRRDAEGKPVGFVRISRDITVQRALEEELLNTNEELGRQNRLVQEASRLKSEFLANMSHELRTPLNSIIGFVELIHDGRVGPVSEPHKEYLGDILTSARHLLKLINDVLDLSKVEAGQMEFWPEPVDVTRVAGEIRDILRESAARKRIAVEVQVDPELGAVELDPGRLKQVLYNYLSNALKFTPEGGRVQVRAVPEDAASFRLEVEDNGMGIRTEDIDRLFVEFQQLDGGMAKQHQGTGLGLALTKRIVGSQGGRVGVRSTPGRGSVFYAVLPRVAARPAEQPAPAQGPARAPRPGAPRVLVVDDERTDRAWLTAILSEAGYVVQAAATGAEALAWCNRQAFDVITLDLLLPDMSNYDLLRAIRSTRPNGNVPVVILSVVAEKGAVAGFHIHDYLVKPVKAGELLTSLRRAGVPPDRARKVLVVDDDPHALRVMEVTLAHLGYEPLCRPDGPSGLQALEREQPAVVVLDLMMPGMDGFEFLRRARRLPAGYGVAIIVWTHKDLTGEDRACLRALAQGVVRKGPGGVALVLDELRHYAGTGHAAGATTDLPPGASV